MQSLAQFNSNLKQGYGLGVHAPLTFAYTQFGTDGTFGGAAIPAAATELHRIYLSPAAQPTDRGTIAGLTDASYELRVVLAYTGTLTAGTGFKLAIAKNGVTSAYLAQTSVIAPAATTVIKINQQSVDARDVNGNIVARFVAGDYLSLYLSAIPAGLTVTQCTLVAKATVNLSQYSVRG